VELKLENPIKWGNEFIETIVFRDVIAKDLRTLKLNAIQFGDILDLAAKLTGHPPSVMDQLSISDAGRVVEQVGKLLDLGTLT
jgi:hypothetical protein